MNTIYFFASSAFFLWTIRNILYWVYLWQLKEYRLDRVVVHLRETHQGKMLMFSPTLLVKLALILGYGYIVFAPERLPLYQLLIAFMFYYEAFKVVQEVISRRLRRPVLTFKALIMLFGTLSIVSLLFVIPIMEPFLWLLILDRIIPFVIAGIVFAFSFPTELFRDYKIEKATKKIQSHKNLLVIGITGSYGKSTTKEFVSQILQRKFRLLKTKGTNNTPIGVASTILSGLKNNTQVFVAEMGAYKKGEIKELCSIARPKIGILTAVSDQHLSLFGSLENTMQAKYELIESLPKNGLALFNGNNENAHTLYTQTKKDKVLYVAEEKTRTKRKADITATNIVAKKESISFDVVIKRRKLHFEAPVIGNHNVEDILPGIYLGNHLGMTDRELIQAVALLQTLPKTMTKQDLSNGAIAIDDTFNASPHAVSAALSYLKVYKQKRILVLQPMIELGKRGQDEHYRIAKEVGKICDEVFLTNKNFYGSFAKGVTEVNPACVVKAASITEIAEYINRKTRKGDVILFEGKEAGIVLDKVL